MAVGKYCEFFDGWYESFVEHFATDAEERAVIVWTDNVDDPRFKNRELVREVRFKEKKPWPDIVMNRHRTYLEVEPLMEEYDYVFFSNVNEVYVGDVRVGDILPKDDKKSRLVGVKHFGLNMDVNPNVTVVDQKWQSEQNPKSRAYINTFPYDYVFGGALVGGYVKEFKEMCHAIADMSAEDMRNGLTAKWHDESYFNRYRLDHMEMIKALSPTYGMPEEAHWLRSRYETKILVLKKDWFFGSVDFR